MADDGEKREMRRVCGAASGKGCCMYSSNLRGMF